MPVKTESFSVSTQGFSDILDITGRVADAVKNSGMQNGLATVFVGGSTAGLTTIEFESGALKDLRRLFEQLAPEDQYYEHNERWHDGNGFAHVRSALIHTSLSVPFSDRRLLLGTWQQIVLLDFDNRHRRRDVIVQIIGE